MKKYLILCLLIAFTTFNACQKETSFDTASPDTGSGGTNNGGSNGSGSDTTTTATSLIGTWNFTGMQSKLVSDMNVTASGISTRAVTTTEYTTTGNSGTLTFTSDKATTKDFAYTVNSTSKVKVYMSGVLFQETSMPFSYSTGNTNGSSNYKAIGSDSIYMPAGGLVSMPDNSGYNGTMPTIAAGYKYKIEGKKLTMTLNTNVVPSYPAQQGMTMTGNSAINMTMTFQKN